MIEKTVFITGADKGLGFSLAQKFAHEGFHVFAGQYGAETNLQTLAERFPQTLTLVPLDVTSMDSVRRAAETVSKLVPALDILINVAGVHVEDTTVPVEQLNMTDGHLEHEMDVNAYGPLRVTQQFLPLLRKGEAKLLINVSSEAGSIADCPRDRWFSYCMSKAALNMQSKILENYLTPDGFKVLVLHPGWMRTDMGGPEADIHPDTSAEGIFGLTVKDWQPGDGMFMDYDGSPRRW